MHAKITMPESILKRLMKGADREKIKTVLFELYKEASMLDEVSLEPDEPGYFSFYINTDHMQAAYGRRDAINYQKNVLITAFEAAILAKYKNVEEGEEKPKDEEAEEEEKPDDEETDEDDDDESTVVDEDDDALTDIASIILIRKDGTKRKISIDKAKELCGDIIETLDTIDWGDEMGK